MAEKKKLVRGRWLLQDASNVLDDGVLVIDGDRIEAVGAWSEIRGHYPDAPVLGGDRYAVIPGLIDAHHHSNGVTTMQHGVPDRLLELWLLSLAARRRTGTYLSTLLSAARLLRSGVTSVVDVFSGHGTVSAFHDDVRGALRAYDEAGMRVAYAAGIGEKSFLVWDEDEAFLASLPPDVRAVAEQRLPGPETLTADDYFAVMEDLQREFRAHPRMAVWYGPPGPQWVSDAVLQRIDERAQTAGVGIQTHLLESVYEKLHGPRRYGTSSVQHLRDLGVLSPRLSIAHGVWLSESDIDILAESGAHVSHNPSSNLRLRAGVAPLNALQAAGVNVALGMDGFALNDDEDMFAEMRLALNLHRPPQLDTPAPSIEQIWHMATEGGARLFQAGAQLGRLASGYAADIVLINLDRLTWPWVAPEADPRLLLLSRARADDVEMVLVAGQVVLQDGQPTGFDVMAAGRELADILNHSEFPWKAAENVQTLMPHVAAHYRNWPFPELAPYEARNSRR